MKFIDINKLSQTAIDIGWDKIEQDHLVAMKRLGAKERKAYITANPDWNKFQAAMMALSSNKCWYSEAPAGNNDLSIEHFRPKNKAYYSEDYKDPNGRIVITKPNGYWWKAYSWDNYRLAGTYANIRRSDRLNEDGVKGKGNFFPLDLSGVGRIADDEESVVCEIPILLDPTVEEDIGLLTFDENGEAISAGVNDYEHNRVIQSIFYYHLDLDQLQRERVMAWKDCERQIKAVKQMIDDAPDERARRIVVSKGLKDIKDYIKNPDRPYSAVIKACVMLYAELDGYNVWLKRFVRSNLI